MSFLLTAMYLVNIISGALDTVSNLLWHRYNLLCVCVPQPSSIHFEPQGPVAVPTAWNTEGMRQILWNNYNSGWATTGYISVQSYKKK